MSGEGAIISWKDHFLNRRTGLICAVTGVMLAVMTILGIRYSTNHPVTGSVVLTGVLFCAAALLYAAAVSLLFLVLPHEDKEGEGRQKEKPVFIRRFLILFLVSSLLHLPVFLAVYPGIYSYDASVQVLQIFGREPLTTHHPLMHTFFFGICLKLGAALFDSYQAGMAIYSIIQSLFMAAVFSFIICRMMERRAPRLLCILSWLFLVVNPYLMVCSFLTTKDVLFGAFFLLSFDRALDFAADPAGLLRNRRQTAIFLGILLMMCLFRNQGIYVFWFYALFFLVLLVRTRCSRPAGKKTVRRWLGFAVSLTAAWYLLTGPVPALMGVEKGDAREMLSVPMQQLARVYHEAPEQLTAEDTAYIETLIDPQALASYVRVNADPVKSGFRTEVLKADPTRFLTHWASIGLRAPGVYLDSFFMGNWGYWYPGDTQYWISYILFDGAFMEEPYNILHITRDSRFPALESRLRAITLTPAFQSVPLLSWILNQAFPFWLLLITAAALIWRRKTVLLVPLTLLLGYWGTLLLGPVTAFRYAVPLIYCVPLLAELLLYPSGFYQIRTNIIGQKISYTPYKD